MQRDRKLLYVTLGLISVLLGAGGSIGSVFAWHVVSFTTTPSTTSTAVGSGIYDTATLQLSDNGGPFGSITWYIYSGTCTDGSPTGSLKDTTSAVSVTSAAEASGGAQYTSPTVSTTGWATGSYVWVAVYSGTGSGGYPGQTAGCEPFTLYAGAPPTVPQFPLGIAALLAIAVPAMLLVRRKASIHIQ